MNITIDWCRYAPRWETIEQLVQDATNSDCKLVGVQRCDNGCNYRAPGMYNVKFKNDQKTSFLVRLTIRGF